MSQEELLTLKQVKFLEVYFQTGNATEAAMQAYDCKDRLSARNIGSENLAKLGITVKDVMEEMGLTDKLLIKKLNELMNAKRKIRRYMPNGQVFEEDVLDTPAVAKGLDIAFKLKGSYTSRFTPQEDIIKVPQTLLDAIQWADMAVKRRSVQEDQENFAIKP